MAGGFFDVVVRTFFSDNGLSAGLAKANAGLNQLGKSGPGARSGLRAVEIGARQLAFSAAGLTGGIGHLARGLLMFGGGSALMLGAVAGVGALAFAYRAFTKDAREAEAAQKKLSEEIDRALQAARASRIAPLQAAETVQQQGRGRLQRVGLELIEARRQLSLMRDDPSGDPVAIAEQETKVNALLAKRTVLMNQLHAAGANIADEAKKEADARRRAAEEAHKLRLELMQLRSVDARITAEFWGTIGRRAGFTPAAFGTLSPESNDPLRSGRGTTFGQGLQLDPLFQGQVFGRRAPAPRFVPDDAGLKRDWLKVGQIMAQSFMQAVIAFRSGGTGGVLGGFGALAAGGSQIEGISKGLAGGLGIAGFGLSLVGGLFSLFDNSEDRRHRQLMEETRRIRQNTEARGEPRNISLTLLLNGKEVSAAVVEDLIYEVGRMERRDATPRLPPR